MGILYVIDVETQDDLYDFMDEMVGDIAHLVKSDDGHSVTPYTDDWETFYRRMEAIMPSEDLPRVTETPLGEQKREFYTRKPEGIV